MRRNSANGNEVLVGTRYGGSHAELLARVFDQWAPSRLPKFVNESISVPPKVRQIILGNSPYASYLPSHLRAIVDEALQQITAEEGSNLALNDAKESGCWTINTVAIDFLQTLHGTVRSRIRQLVLLEDRKSMAFQESHALGLISFCHQNPRLRIHRLVDLWRTCFTPERYGGGFSGTPTAITPEFAAASAYSWIVEAHALAAAGMPTEAFKLTFDAPPSHLQSFYNTFNRNAAIQEAFEGCFERGYILQSSEEFYVRFRASTCLVSDTFPSAIRDLIQGTSMVEMGVEEGELWDTEQLIKCAKGWTIREWEYEKNAQRNN
ncbi:hypothetical protein BU23DRAFT_653132 [Bimuria novae-zelandiae CBS 107.79]|uniref:Uncharacterized protein n=1 Tax=Bimuria novae-zelandiae CBS 107.79 TaxID=1447943 RepID=A0A6A5V7U2_9PLEO|nr:hypothetical protein BU23DRAFT_653132 [Bimuria novae-zelandiae CBS 107.79]